MKEIKDVLQIELGFKVCGEIKQISNNRYSAMIIQGGAFNENYPLARQRVRFSFDNKIITNISFSNKTPCKFFNRLVKMGLNHESLEEDNNLHDGGCYFYIGSKYFYFLDTEKDIMTNCLSKNNEATRYKWKDFKIEFKKTFGFDLTKRNISKFTSNESK